MSLKKTFNFKLILISLLILLFSSSCSKSNIKDSESIVNNNTQVINKETNNSSNEIEDKKDDTEQSNDQKEKDALNKNSPLIYNDRAIPVLMYHSINYEEGNELMVPKEQFREQMNYLYENGYTTLTLNQLYDFFINNKPIPEKSVVITLDDGYKDNYTNAFPILKEFNFNAVVFVITNNIDNHKNFLTSEQILEMDKNGIEIQSHTANHERLPTLSYENQVRTLKVSKEFLEKLLNKESLYIAYPYGDANSDTIKAAKEAGYKMAFTTKGTWSDKTDGILSLDRVYISANFDMDEFHRRLTNKDYK
ncbi:polysaccharide deacetylase family protein [Clostridium sp. MSJ-11]|uniref:Polysaccharide deacetylase family protein n=1 Tax=Clostridium mobile TaxID=2841512 RepID=A0ABS6ELX8_9CLOT|nr:polysaccharide deacetylase family protein [Clostridium mobile]MBU5486231.1 polysaccharide deacetylase family protein [Clostridium mobile]